MRFTMLGYVLIFKYPCFICIFVVSFFHSPQDAAADGPTSMLIPGGISSDTSAAKTDMSATCSQDFESKTKINLRQLVADPLVLQAWDEFVDTKLRSIIEHQISGSFQQTSATQMLINYKV